MTYSKNDPETIRSMFDSIAKNYDRTNAVLSLGMHNRWNSTLINKVLVPSKPRTILDLCCGTGAISLDYLRKVKEPIKAYLLDFSGEMLKYAQQRAEVLPLSQHQVEYLQADAQFIPLMKDSVDCVTIAYGIRNVKEPKKCIEEIYRVLSSDGTVGILELTEPKNPLMHLGHSLYLRTLLPILGKLLTTNQDAYQYLNQSIKSFIPPEKLKEIMHEVGFQEVQCISLLGGVATLIIGKKNKP
jgi:demethylmenaquinone methyltransferase/2-methoxy-6-polyprenyl-1,4-benzoquinol methylase